MQTTSVAIILAGTMVTPPHESPKARCSCRESVQRHVWCDACNVGYVAGLKIPSALLFEVLDAHGHEVDPQFIPCKRCRWNYDEGGYCPQCRIGYVEKLAYMSPLTYYLGLGKHADPEALTCDRCRDLAESLGWCDDCARGMAGNVRFEDRKAFQSASREFRRLKSAVKAITRCEGCAVVIMTDGECWTCKTAYRDGLPVRTDDAENKTADDDQ